MVSSIATKHKKVSSTLFIICKQLHIFKYFSVILLIQGGCPRGVMAKAMDCGIIEREFVLQSRYYVHFRENTLWKGMNPAVG